MKDKNAGNTQGQVEPIRNKNIMPTYHQTFINLYLIHT